MSEKNSDIASTTIHLDLKEQSSLIHNNDNILILLVVHVREAGRSFLKFCESLYAHTILVFCEKCYRISSLLWYTAILLVKCCALLLLGRNMDHTNNYTGLRN
jgi:hypothetical protein